MSVAKRRRLISVTVALVVITMGAVILAAASPVQAQEEEGAESLELPAMQLQRFRPAPGPADYITVFGTGVSEHLDWNVGSYFNYGTNPMQLGSLERSGERTVLYQSGLDLLATMGLFGHFEVGLIMSTTLSQRSNNLQPLLPSGSPERSDLPRTGLNDLQLTTKYQFQGLHEARLGLALVGGMSIPVGRRNALTSDEGVGAELMAVGEYVFWKTIRTSANLGFRYRPGSRQIQENILGNEIIWGLGAHAPFLTDDLDVLAEVGGAVAVQSEEPLSGIAPGEVPVEAMGGLRYGFFDDWSATAGMAAGLGDGIGAPRWRFFIGISGKWATGGWWNVNYHRPQFKGVTDPCDPRVRDAEGRRLRFDPSEDCPDYYGDHIEEDDERSMAWLEEPSDPPDPAWFDRIQEEGSDEEGDAALRQGAIIITEEVTFETGSADLQEGSFSVLDDVATLLNRHSDIERMRIEGHTDSVGAADMNLELSEERAESVRQYLITVGVDATRVQAVGYGESRPVADNDTEEGRAKNRRVEFNIMEMAEQ